MFPINYLSGALSQSAQVQIREASEKAQQARRARDLEKNVAARDDELEHQVENSEELAPTHEQDQRGNQKKRQQYTKPDDEESSDEEPGGLDLKA